MGKEIERKFLIKPEKRLGLYRDIVTHMPTSTPERITQGYLDINPAHVVRVRVVNETRGLITVKGETEGITRPEFEYEIPVDDAKALMDMCDAALFKIRYHVMVGGFPWAIDYFTGTHLDGLILAEIELTSEDEQFPMPEWAGPEVSYNPEYFNVSLAVNGVTSDKYSNHI
jgi:adenylate cyclase